MTDSTYQPKVYRKQGGDELVVASGGVITIESGGTITVAGVDLIDEVAALSGLDSGELGVLNGVTGGTVTASKAVVVDANKDIGDFRNLDAVNIDAGASGTAGSVDVYPTTASKGKLTISATDNTNNDAVTITNAAHGQATTVTIPDGGAATTYVVQSTAALTLAEADVLDGATAGTQVANKAVIADANVNTGVSKVTQLHIGTSGAETQVTATGAELNTLDDVPVNVETTSTTPASGTCAVQFTFKDAAGATISHAVTGKAYFSAADGLSIAAVTSAATLTNGAWLNEVAGSTGMFITSAAGLLGITVTAGAGTYYLSFQMPSGAIVTSDAIVVNA